MGRYDVRPCPCGSGKDSVWLRDARGIECCRICDDCEQEKKSKYRPEVLDDPNYEADEPIEPEWDEDDVDPDYDMGEDDEVIEPEDQDPGDVLGDWDETEKW